MVVTRGTEKQKRMLFSLRLYQSQILYNRFRIGQCFLLDILQPTSLMVRRENATTWQTISGTIQPGA